MQHIETQILGQTVHADTLFFTWACMGFILLLSVFLVSGLSANVDKFGKRQFFEVPACREPEYKDGQFFIVNFFL